MSRYSYEYDFQPMLGLYRNKFNLKATVFDTSEEC